MITNWYVCASGSEPSFDEQLIWDRVVIELDLGRVDVEVLVVDLGCGETRIVEERTDALTREEPQVGAVEQARLLVGESPLQERQTDAAVGHIRQ